VGTAILSSCFLAFFVFGFWFLVFPHAQQQRVYSHPPFFCFFCFVFWRRCSDEARTFVINKQAPNKQVWLSSPLTGPGRYEWGHAARDWIATRDGHPLGQLLDAQVARVLGSDEAEGIGAQAAIIEAADETL
jgi:hypothetical protein